jgi:hypothetical protein
MVSKRPFETVCKDFGTRKGCNQKILMKPTNEMKEDGSGPRWKAYELEGTELHTHDKKPTTNNPQEKLTGGAPTSSPIATTTPNTIMLEHQVATLATEVEGLKLRVQELEKAKVKSEADALTNADENELGDLADE